MKTAQSGRGLDQRAQHAGCATCTHFDADPASIENQIGGLRSLGSGFSAVRAQDGICRKHERYLAASSWCAAFARRES